MAEKRNRPLARGRGRFVGCVPSRKTTSDLDGIRTAPLCGDLRGHMFSVSRSPGFTARVGPSEGLSHRALRAGGHGGSGHQLLLAPEGKWGPASHQPVDGPRPRPGAAVMTCAGDGSTVTPIRRATFCVVAARGIWILALRRLP